MKIPVYGGLSIVSDKFLTGKLIVLRRSLQDIYEHGLEDATLMKWLSTFTPQSIHDWIYEGWGKNRPYEVSHPLYDPNHPDKKKHPESDFFLYYSLVIDGEKYWANVKMHKNENGEVLYTIESEEPEDVIKGLPDKKKRRNALTPGPMPIGAVLNLLRIMQRYEKYQYLQTKSWENRKMDEKKFKNG